MKIKCVETACSQQTLSTISKSTIETLKKGVKYVKVNGRDGFFIVNLGHTFQFFLAF